MILTGKNQSTQRKTCPTVILSPTNMTCHGLGLAQSSAVTGQQLTACALVWPISQLIHNLILPAVLPTETACLRGREINSSANKSQL